MSSTQMEISEVLGKLGRLTPSGYILGIHQHFSTTKFMFQTYKKEWLDFYSKNSLVMSDPTVAWCFENVGSCRWSDLDDPAGVLQAAADHGLGYGAIFATSLGGSRSMSGFARNDREFTDEEIAEISDLVEQVHKATADQAELSRDTVQQLKNMSILVTHPGS